MVKIILFKKIIIIGIWPNQQTTSINKFLKNKLKKLIIKIIIYLKIYFCTLQNFLINFMN